jgi:hypothetical protein
VYEALRAVETSIPGKKEDYWGYLEKKGLSKVYLKAKSVLYPICADEFLGEHPFFFFNRQQR